ncbi:MAG: rhodanese-like domain-containing protein [Leptonema sp. (in: Bacteria)]|nr:rhodanese-like domain-containing protein [Leptonema sp. (in: bacteria)]
MHNHHLPNQSSIESTTIVAAPKPNEGMKEILPTMIMHEIISHYPSAQRALFQQYHIGGCSSCGFALTDTLEQVMENHDRGHQVNQAIAEIYESARVDQEMQIEPDELKASLDSGEKWRIVDVRDPFEAEIAQMPGAELLDKLLAKDMLLNWPKDTKVVFICHSGMRSLEATSYFKGHGLINAKNLKGGIDRWAEEIDTTIPRY